MEIVTVGAGLAGLTTAIAMAKAGHKVTVLESAAQIMYIGIQISSNSSRILRQLGIEQYIEKYCTEPIDLRMMRWDNGHVLSEAPLKQPAEEEYKSPYWHIHRADFHRGLLECASELGVKVLVNHQIVKVEPQTPAVYTKDGKCFTADLIVASDGLHSICRAVVLGHPNPPVPTGQMVYRITLPARKLRGIPELEEFIETPRNNHWVGPNGTVLSYLLQGIDEPLMNFVFTCDVTMPDGINQRKTDSEGVRAAYKGWDPRIHRMLEFVDEVLEWRLYTHDPISTWTHPSNKLVLIGDAAHAMTPYLAQGAAMGIEDAAILGGILNQPQFHTSDRTSIAEALPPALRLYEQLRLGRTAKVAEASISSRWFTQMGDGEEQRSRDEWLLAHPGIWKGHKNIRAKQEFLDELFGYDAYSELQTALDSKT